MAVMKHNVILPNQWNKDLAYIFGLLLGDGSLPLTKSKKPNGKLQKRHMIFFYSGSKQFIEEIYIPLFERTFGIKPYVQTIKKRPRKLYNCRIESKDIYGFLAKKGFTLGRKARKAKIPNLPKKYNVHLLAGLLDADGGKKGSGFGLSTASKHLAKFCINVFEDLNLPYNSCPWRYNNHTYH